MDTKVRNIYASKVAEMLRMFEETCTDCDGHKEYSDGSPCVCTLEDHCGYDDIING